MSEFLNAQSITQQIRSALAEDLGSGDLTAALIDAGARAKVEVICRDQARDELRQMQGSVGRIDLMLQPHKTDGLPLLP